MEARLQLIGLSHKTAPLDLRERLHVGATELPGALAALEAVPSVEECFILSTCNRVEVMAQRRARNGSFDPLVDFLCDYHGERVDGVEPHLYRLESAQAVGHLFRVTSSLDSMVVGEPQIVAQVREAMTVARSAGTLGPVLGSTIDRALAVSKRVRTETGIARNAVSISYAAVELARKIFGDLERRRALLLGAGEMSELAARHLLKHGVDELLVANRSQERAKELADAVGGKAVPWDDWPALLEEVDIVLGSTAAPQPVVKARMVRDAMPRRRHRPVFFIDIAVPRDVEPAVNQIDNVYLYDVDDLQGVVEENLEERSRHAEVAERIVAEETDRFTASLQALDLGPTIAAIRRLAEDLRRRELERMRGRLGELSPEQVEAVDALTRGIVNKLLHGPMTGLKQVAREADDLRAAEMARLLWDLEARDTEDS